MLRLLFRSNLTQVPYEICWVFFLVNQIGKYIINQKKKPQIKLSEDCTVMFPPKNVPHFVLESLNFFKKSFNTDPIKLKEYYLGHYLNCKYQVSSCMAFRHMMNMRIYMKL